MTLQALLRADMARFTQTYKLRGQPYSRLRIVLESVLLKASFQAVLLYRLSHWLYKHGLLYVAWYLTRLNVMLTGAEIEFNAEIGPGLFIAHPVGIVVGRGTVIGARATLFHGVTFGVKSWHPDAIRKFPRVGNDCYFFAHAVVLGDIVVGDRCVVAAQAVVTQDLPSGSLAAGVPARVYPDKGREAIASWLGGASEEEGRPPAQ